MKAENIIKTVVVCVDGKDGRTVASCLNSEGEVVRGKARCVGGDEFKPEIGAIIALCKAMGVAPAKACFDVMNVYAKESAAEMEKARTKEAEVKVRKVKVEAAKPSWNRDKQKIADDLKGIPVGLVKRGHCALKPTGVLANEPGVTGYGRMGTPTNFYDRNGKQLYVGDLVAVEVLDGNVRTGRHWKAITGLTFVVDEQSNDPLSKGQYIMGLMSGCNPKTGKIDGRFRVKKAKSWVEVEVGETNSNGQVTVVWEDEV